MFEAYCQKGYGVELKFMFNGGVGQLGTLVVGQLKAELEPRMGL